MSSSFDNLLQAVSPVQVARAVNPTRPEYYRADDVKAASKAENATPSVTVTLSDEAKALLKA